MAENRYRPLLVGKRILSPLRVFVDELGLPHNPAT